MNLGMIPTDNLYKFMAIAGLSICAISIVVPYNWIIEAENRLFKEKLDIQLLQAEIQLYEEKKSRSISLGESKDKSESDYKIERMEKFLPKIVHLENSREKFERETDRMLYVSTMAIIGVILGSLSFLIGFRLWYINVQKPQDLEMAEKSKKSINFLLGKDNPDRDSSISETGKS